MIQIKGPKWYLVRNPIRKYIETKIKESIKLNESIKK